MLLQVCVPADLLPGDEFDVQAHNGQAFTISVPEGCWSGDLIEVDLPVEEGGTPDEVEVTVPDGCWPGDSFLVAFDGIEFDITVPEGCSPGDLLKVTVPASEVSPTPPRSRRASQDEIRSRRASLDSKQREEYTTSDSFSSSASSSSTPQTPPIPIMGSHLFWLGQEVEVCRSDGSWTAAEVEDYDVLGDTYTVAVLGEQGVGAGRQRLMKYFVEPHELRSARAGAYRRGQLVDVQRGATLHSNARVDEFDEESGCYTLRTSAELPTGKAKLLFFVEQEEILTAHRYVPC